MHTTLFTYKVWFYPDTYVSKSLRGKIKFQHATVTELHTGLQFKHMIHCHCLAFFICISLLDITCHQHYAPGTWWIKEFSAQLNWYKY